MRGRWEGGARAGRRGGKRAQTWGIKGSNGHLVPEAVVGGAKIIQVRRTLGGWAETQGVEALNVQGGGVGGHVGGRGVGGGRRRCGQTVG